MVVEASRTRFWDLEPQERWNLLVRPVETDLKRVRRGGVQTHYSAWSLVFPVLPSGWRPVASFVVDFETKALVLLLDNCDSKGPWKCYSSPTNALLKNATYTVQDGWFPEAASSWADKPLVSSGLYEGVGEFSFEDFEALYPAYGNEKPSDDDVRITKQNEEADRKRIEDLISSGAVKPFPFKLIDPVVLAKGLDSMNAFSLVSFDEEWKRHKTDADDATGGTAT